MEKTLINSNIEIAGRQTVIKAFRNAWNGIVQFFQTERNGKIQLGAAIVTIATGFILHITALQWIIILLCVATVFCLEMMNTAIENICDLISSSYHPTIKKIKDVAAGAVLIASVASILIALIIFLPKILMFI